jgi:ferredoxin
MSLGDVSAELIDRDACMGSGNCVCWAPADVDPNGEGVAIVRDELAGHEEQVRVAAANCPTWAIRVGGLFPAALPER